MTFFDGEVLSEDLEIFGHPMLHTKVASTVAQANLAAVLSMVAPDGKATLVSFGVANLTHRNSHAEPEPMVPGVFADLSVQLNVIGQRIPAGYRLRLALSSAYWPLIWPSAEKAELTLAPGCTALELPLNRDGDGPELAPFAAPEGAPPLQTKVLRQGSTARRRTVDYATGEETCTRLMDGGAVKHLHTGLEVGSENADEFRIHPDDPNSATGTSRWRMTFARGDWKAEVETEVTVSAQAKVWHITAALTARDADGIVKTRQWDEEVPRDLV